MVLDELLGLELSIFAKFLQMRPGAIDDHVLLQQVVNDMWFRQMDYERNAQERKFRRNLTLPEESLMALALGTKPYNRAELYLAPRLCTLGDVTLEHAPPVIKEIHMYLKKLLNER